MRYLCLIYENEKAWETMSKEEADAIFGKRSEVRDSHDRYANLEISFLLQRMERFDGLAILATNLRENMDEAFVRRLQFIVGFPFPDAEQREHLWALHLPPEAPRDLSTPRNARAWVAIVPLETQADFCPLITHSSPSGVAWSSKAVSGSLKAC